MGDLTDVSNTLLMTKVMTMVMAMVMTIATTKVMTMGLWTRDNGFISDVCTRKMLFMAVRLSLNCYG